MELKFNDLEGLMNDVEGMQKNAEAVSKGIKLQSIAKIVGGVARKYASKWVDREDLEQDLWVKVYEMAESWGGIENLDEKLVARCCYNLAVDKYRKDRRRYESNQAFCENTDDGEECDGTEYLHCAVDDIESIALYKEVIDIYPQGSRQRLYIVLRLVNLGVLPIEYLDEADRMNFQIPENERETGYIHCLGYKSHSPGSWISMKRKMKQDVLDFLRG